MVFTRMMQSPRAFTWVPALSIFVAIMLAAAVGLLGLARDLQSIRHSIFDAEINQARSHVERTVGRIESDLLEGLSMAAYQLEKKPRWLVDHWRRTIPGKPDRMYAAIVDAEGLILAHSDFLDNEKPEHERLSDGWDANTVEGFGPGVAQISNGPLSHLGDAIDISAQVIYQNQNMGSYHTGLDLAWLNRRVWEGQREAIRVWAIVITAIGAIVLGSSILLYRLGVRAKRMEQALDQAETRRLAGLSRLIVGMAHELRNPLNAVRLNLFTSQKVFAGTAQISSEEAAAMIEESVREVERVDDLIGQLLGYARVNTQAKGECKVHDEIFSILQFLKQLHEKDGIQIAYNNEAPTACIGLDARLFRQVLLNLLNNAREAIGKSGRIEIVVANIGTQVTIQVQDSGPGIAADQFEQIFEPFYTTRDDGVGMGLAVVNSIVEGANGRIECRRSTALGGMDFVITLPVLRCNEEVTDVQ
ncbi:sensor histidine kinase [Pirellulaceae bacterium SH501]